MSLLLHIVQRQHLQRSVHLHHFCTHVILNLQSYDIVAKWIACILRQICCVVCAGMAIADIMGDPATAPTECAADAALKNVLPDLSDAGELTKRTSDDPLNQTSASPSIRQVQDIGGREQAISNTPAVQTLQVRFYFFALVFVFLLSLHRMYFFAVVSLHSALFFRDPFDLELHSDMFFHNALDADFSASCSSYSS